jgi:hypothetical protein
MSLPAEEALSAIAGEENAMPIDMRQQIAGTSSSGGSKAAFWIGWVLTVLTALFMLFDTVGHYLMPQTVLDAFVRIGFPANRGAALATIELVCVSLYIVRRTAMIGAILLTGYFGGAIAIQMRAGSSLFETIFPLIVGVIAWAGIYLREVRLRRLIPIRA